MILIDTNVFIWQIGPQNNSKLGKQATDLLLSNSVFVSSITIVECHIKTMLGKLNTPPELLPIIKDSGNQILGFGATSADKLPELDLHKHDPFDRMLLAQAIDNNMKFMTSDELILNLGLDFVIDARR